jgi:hypothetical protein
MLIGFLRDNESEKPYRQKVKKGKPDNRVKWWPQNAGRLVFLFQV